MARIEKKLTFDEVVTENSSLRTLKSVEESGAARIKQISVSLTESEYQSFFEKKKIYKQQNKIEEQKHIPDAAFARMLILQNIL